MPTTTITRELEDGTEIEIIVEYSISKYRPAVSYLRNGDPGYPAEGGEVEVSSAIRLDTGEAVVLTDDEFETVSDEATEPPDDDYEPDFEHGLDPDDYDAYDEPYCWED